MLQIFLFLKNCVSNIKLLNLFDGFLFHPSLGKDHLSYSFFSVVDIKLKIFISKTCNSKREKLDWKDYYLTQDLIQIN